MFRLLEPLPGQLPALQKCEPPIWALSGHAQTLAGHFLPSPKINEASERLEIPLAGGDTLIARLFEGTSDAVIYLFHGLGGQSHRSYMQRTALLARRLHHSVILVNHRGCGEGRGLAREPYHSGRSDDLSAVIEFGRRRFPIKKHVAVGFSLSANALLLLAAAHHPLGLKVHPPDAAIAVNAPINLARSAELLLQGFNRLYDINFMRDMREAVRSRRLAGFEIPDLGMTYGTTLRDFDELYTSKHSGFTDRAHYYRSASAAPILQRIRIPTVLLTAADDPFVDVADYQQAELSPSVQLHIEKHGGHMGYLSRSKTPLGTKRWLGYALFSYLSRI